MQLYVAVQHQATVFAGLMPRKAVHNVARRQQAKSVSSLSAPSAPRHHVGFIVMTVSL